MPSLLLGGLLMSVHLERWPLALAGHGIHLILVIAHWVAALPQAMMLAPSMPVAVLILLTVAGAIALFWRGPGAFAAVAPAMMALMLFLSRQPPDILVSGDARLLGRARWRRLPAVEPGQRPLRRPRLAAESRRRAQATRYAGRAKAHCSAGRSFARRAAATGKPAATRSLFSFAPWTQIADCAWADILVAQQPVFVRDCHAPLIVDRFDVWRDGAMAIWRDGRAVSVHDDRGDRPWCIQPATRRAQ